MIDFYIKKGDLLPVLRVELNDASDNSVSISGATVAFNYKLRTNGSSVVNRSAIIEDETNGIVQYPWVSGDTSTLGIYNGEFVVTFAGGKQTTFPQGNPIVFEVVEEI